MNTLKLCQNNLKGNMQELIKKAKTEYTNVQITVEPCLGRCDQCAQTHIALANDEFLTADTTDLMFERIKNIIGEREVATPNKR